MSRNNRIFDNAVEALHVTMLRAMANTNDFIRTIAAERFSIVGIRGIAFLGNLRSSISLKLILMMVRRTEGSMVEPALSFMIRVHPLWLLGEHHYLACLYYIGRVDGCMRGANVCRIYLACRLRRQLQDHGFLTKHQV